MKKRVVVVFLLLALAAGAVYWHQNRARASAGGSLVLYGNVDIREVALGFRVPGRLSSMNYEEGDRVEPGQILAELDKIPLQEDLDVRQAQLREIQASLANAEKNYERRVKLVQSGSMTASDYDDALALRDELRARLETAGAQLKQAKTSLDDAALMAPNSGIILSRVREPGSILSAGTTVYTLALDSPVWVRTYIDEPDLGRLQPGQKVRVLTDSGGRYEARIGFISPQAEFTPKTVETTRLRTDLVYRLRVVVENPDQGLRQGMPVTVEF